MGNVHAGGRNWYHRMGYINAGGRSWYLGVEGMGYMYVWRRKELVTQYTVG